MALMKWHTNGHGVLPEIFGFISIFEENDIIINEKIKLRQLIK